MQRSQATERSEESDLTRIKYFGFISYGKRFLYAYVLELLSMGGLPIL